MCGEATRSTTWSCPTSRPTCPASSPSCTTPTRSSDLVSPIDSCIICKWHEELSRAAVPSRCLAWGSKAAFHVQDAKSNSIIPPGVSSGSANGLWTTREGGAQRLGRHSTCTALTRVLCRGQQSILRSAVVCGALPVQALGALRAARAFRTGESRGGAQFQVREPTSRIG